MAVELVKGPQGYLRILCCEATGATRFTLKAIPFDCELIRSAEVCVYHQLTEPTYVMQLAQALGAEWSHAQVSPEHTVWWNNLRVLHRISLLKTPPRDFVFRFLTGVYEYTLVSFVPAARIAGGILVSFTAGEPEARPLSPRPRIGGPAAQHLPGHELMWFSIIPDDQTDIFQIPAALTTALEGGRSVLFAGAGLSAQMGYPTWRKYLRSLLDFSRAEAILPEDDLLALEESYRQGEYTLVADSIALDGWRDDDRRSKLLGHLRSCFPTEHGPLSEAHEALSRIKFAAALTTNFDRLLEDTFPGCYARFPHQSDEIKNAISKEEPFILNLYGIPEIPGTLQLSSPQFRQFAAENVAFNEALDSLFVSRTILFVGCSMAGIESYLSGIRLSPAISVQHFAIVDVRGISWRSRAQQLKLRYNIEVIPYTATEGCPELAKLLRKMVPRGSAVAVVEDSPKPLVLCSVTLKNIGPFADLTLSFEPGWTVLLGGNGVGKSIILRAIATAFTGKRAGECAPARLLLRSGETKGRIELTTVHQTVIMDLLDTGRSTQEERVRLTASPENPVELEKYPILAFPPLRSMWTQQREPDRATRPIPEDVLPLAMGDQDSRMGTLKGWLVDLDLLSAAEVGQGPNTELRKAFLTVLQKLATGIAIEELRVDERKRVFVTVGEQELPLEALSQGTSSLMCWIGVLLQRLSEVSSSTEEITSRRALVLIDEIDTHMHPEWQRQLPVKLRDLFPNVQFIVTTHSPLLVAGMTREQIYTVERTPDGVMVERPAQDLWGLRADEILLSSVFGVADVKTPEYVRSLRRWTELSEKRGLEVWQELAVLRRQKSAVRAVSWSSDGGVLASVMSDGSLNLWGAESGKHTLVDSPSPALFAAWEPNGQRLASCYEDGTVIVWAAAYGGRLLHFKAHSEPVYEVAWRADGKELATFSNDATVCIWDTRRGELARRLEPKGGLSSGMAWRPDGKLLVSAFEDGTLRTWDVSTGEEMERFTGHTSIIFSVAWSPDGRRIASGSGDGTVRVWDPETGREQLCFAGGTTTVYSVVWRDDGQLVSAGADHTVRIWDAANGSPVAVLEGHEGDVTCVACRRDGLRIASGARDGSIRIWESKPKMSADEEREFAELEQRFNRIGLNPAEIPIALQAAHAIQEFYESRMSSIDEEKRQRLITEIQSRLLEARKPQ